ncbi:hypothetical protein FB561_5352 [Kribbella amoyensis]|uniref:Toxin-antitoxin system, toxin component n=1 Tax=Kribbella amoyensis TaxID=996641 RepID=A0A561BZE5_9ACTN|nr:toxin-antitoxin system, toxin component [Kribbella amoyensis]TWD84177.1 hypothetical protein FB561_5352 [Kribbella amoyensis]
MTTSPPQPPHNQYPGQPAPGGYGPPPQDQGPQHHGPQGQFPQYTQQQPENFQPGPYDQPPHGQPQHGQPQHGQPYEQQGQPQYGQPGGGPQYGQEHGQQFGQPGPAQFGQQPQPGMAPMPGGTMQCRFCGAVPAVPATVRGHQGLIIVMRFLKLEGPYCKTCGTAAVRDMTSKSMVAGWWGIGSLIVNPITMLMNLGPANKFKNLPEPAPGAPGRPMDPGKPLFKRPQVIGLVVPLAVILLIVIGNISNLSSPSSASVGDCIHNAGSVSKPDVKVVDCTSSDADYKVLGKVSTSDESQCEQYEGYTVAYTEERSSSAYTLCLGPN